MNIKTKLRQLVVEKDLNGIVALILKQVSHNNVGYNMKLLSTLPVYTKNPGWFVELACCSTSIEHQQELKLSETDMAELGKMLMVGCQKKYPVYQQ